MSHENSNEEIQNDVPEIAVSEQKSEFTFSKVDSETPTVEAQNFEIAKEQPEVVLENTIDPVKEVVSQNKVNTEPVKEEINTTPSVDNGSAESEEDYEYEEIDEISAFNFLREKRGITAENLEDFLKEKEQKKLSPEIEKFLEFQEKTGNTNYTDFLATQKDWNAESPEDVIKQILKLENPDLNKDEINFIYEDKYESDEEYDSEKDIKSKTIEKKRELRRALSILEKQKEEYMVNRGSDDFIPKEYKEAKEALTQIENEQKEYNEVIETNRKDFVSQTSKVFNENFEGFKVNIDGKEFIIKPEDVNKTKEIQLDVSNFRNKYFDENGRIIDVNGYHKSLYAGMNPDLVAKHFYNLGKAEQAEIEDRLSKNISVDTPRNMQPGSTNKFTFSVVK